jgi:hypothetical protein
MQVTPLSAFAVTAFAVVVPCTAQATCWLVGNLTGQSYKAASEYQAVADGLTGKVFSVTINGNRGSLVPANGMVCSPVTQTLLSCAARDGQTASTELWFIDSSAQKAVFTKVRTGSGPFDGASVFIGDPLGQCK